MNKKSKRCLRLFLTFLKIGAFTFGGGYAMIPLIQREAAEKQGWVSDEDILEVVAIAEATPGPIAINAATFVGYRAAGFWGALSATVGVVLPSFLVILAISGVLRQFQANPIVANAFFGIRTAVLALILKAMWGMYQKCRKDILSWCVMAGVFVSVAFLKFPAILVLVAAALTGLAVTLAGKREKL